MSGVIGDWFRREPVLLERVHGTAPARLLRAGIDLISSDGWRGHESTMASDHLVGHQLWTRVRLTILPARPMIVGGERDDRFRLQLDRRYNIIDECARQFAGLDVTRTITMRVVRAGTIVTAFIEDPLVQEDTRVEVCIFGFEVAARLLFDVEEYVRRSIQ